MKIKTKSSEPKFKEQNRCGKLDRPTGQAGFAGGGWGRSGVWRPLDRDVHLNKGIECICGSGLVSERGKVKRAVSDRSF